MKTENDRTVEEHGKGHHEASFGVAEAPMTEAETGPENVDSLGHDVPTRPGPDLISDERLTSAAAPFLYLLSIILTAVTGYFLYIFFHS